MNEQLMEAREKLVERKKAYDNEIGRASCRERV